MNSVTLHDPQIQLGRADTLVFTARVDGVAADITSAAFTVYRGSVADKTGMATVHPTIDGQFSVAFDGTEWATPYIDLRIAVVVTLESGEVFESNRLFSVVNFKVVTTCDDDMLKAYSPGLRSHLWTDTTTYQVQIQQALVEVLGALRRRGYSGAEIVDVSQLDQAVAWKAMEIIYGGFSRQPDDVWRQREIVAAERYKDAIHEIVLDVSSDYSGEATEKIGFAVIRCQR